MATLEEDSDFVKFFAALHDPDTERANTELSVYKLVAKDENTLKLVKK